MLTKTRTENQRNHNITWTVWDEKITQMDMYVIHHIFQKEA